MSAKEVCNIILNNLTDKDFPNVKNAIYNEWISVQERLPEDYEEVLYLAINEMGIKERMTGHRENSLWMHCCWFYSSMRCDSTIKVTHWMPLPEPPK